MAENPLGRVQAQSVGRLSRTQLCSLARARRAAVPEVACMRPRWGSLPSKLLASSGRSAPRAPADPP
eukprot:5345944-Pyramimonas_sp.AAC.1